MNPVDTERLGKNVGRVIAGARIYADDRIGAARLLGQNGQGCR